MGSDRALRGVTNRMVRDVLARAIKAGCVVEVTKAQHIKITTPSGAVVFTGLTSPGPYAHLHVLRGLRHAGVHV